MNPNKTKITSFFKSRKANVFILFVILSFLFLVLTKLSKEYTQTVRFQINTTEIPEDKVIIVDSLHYLDITLSTFGFKFVSYFMSKPKLNISFDALDKDESNYYWTREKGFSEIVSQFQSNVRIESINPDTLQFRYDTNMVKSVPVTLNSEIDFSGGFDITNGFQLQPDSVKVIGPKVLVESIDELQTQLLSQQDVNKNIDAFIQLDLAVLPADLNVSEEIIHVTAQVEKFTEGAIEVPVIIRNIPDHVKLNYYPKEVTVFYYTSLSNFKNVTSGNFVVACDYNSIDEDRSYLTAELITKPERVKNVKLSTNRIEYIIVQ